MYHRVKIKKLPNKAFGGTKTGQQTADGALAIQPRTREAAEKALGKARTIGFVQWEEFKKRYPSEEAAAEAFIDKYMADSLPPTLRQALEGSKKPSAAPSTTGGPVTVVAPNGTSYTFPNQEAADKFKKEANIK